MRIAAVACVLALTLVAVSRRGAAAQPGPLEVTLTLDRGAYEPGTLIGFTVRVTNISREPVSVTFTTSQRFDVSIQSETFELDRWSRGRVFTPTVAEVRWAPGETIVYADVLSPGSALLPTAIGIGSPVTPLSFGVYRVVADVTGTNIRVLSRPAYLIVGTPIMLAAGCTPLQTPFPTDLPVGAIVAMVEPREALLSLWQRALLTNDYLGYTPAREPLNDLTSVHRRSPLTICLAYPARMTIP